MKWVLAWAVGVAVFLWVAVQLDSVMVKAAKEGEKEKEQCIVWKYEKNAQKFLDNNCTVYVRWNQDN